MTLAFSQDEKRDVNIEEKETIRVRLLRRSAREKENGTADAEHPRWNLILAKSKERAGYNSLLISFGIPVFKSISIPVIGCLN